MLLPAVRPAAALGALVVFALTVSELGVPVFLRSRAYTEAVFSRLGGIDYAPGEAVALSLPLLALGLVLVGLERRWFGRRRLRLLGLRADREPLPLGPWRLPAALAAATAAVAAAAPIAALAWKAADGGFGELASWLSRSHWNSLVTAGAAAAAAAALGVVLGHAYVHARPVAGVADVVLFVGFLSPSAVLAVGLAAAWNRPATAWVYRTLAILVVAGVARYGVLALRAAAIAFGQNSSGMEDAARTAGAGYLRRLLGIVVPVHRRGVAAAFLLTFVFCLRDLETAIFFYPPGGEPLTVRIFTLEANGPAGVVAALALVQVLIAAAVLAAGSLLLLGRKEA